MLDQQLVLLQPAKPELEPATRFAASEKQSLNQQLFFLQLASSMLEQANLVLQSTTAAVTTGNARVATAAVALFAAIGQASATTGQTSVASGDRATTTGDGGCFVLQLANPVLEPATATAITDDRHDDELRDSAACGHKEDAMCGGTKPWICERAAVGDAAPLFP